MLSALRRLATPAAKDKNATTLEVQRRERERRAAASTVAAVAARGVLLVVSLVSLPIAIGYLGPERYGVFVALFSLTSMFVFADLGLGNGVLNLVSGAHGRGDRPAAGRFVSSAFFMLVVVAGVIGVGFALIYPLIDWSGLFHLTNPQAMKEVGPTAAILVVVFVLGLPIGIAERARMAYQEGFLNSFAAIAGTLAGLAGLIISIHLSASLPVIVLAMSAPPLLALGCNALWLVVHDRPWLMPRLSMADRTTATKLARIGFLFLVLQLAIAIAFQADVVIAASVIGSTAATTYAVTLRVFMLVPSLVGLLLLALWPAYTEALARGDAEWIRRVLRRSFLIALGSSTASSLMLLGVGPWIIGVLSDGAVNPPFALILGAALWAVVQSSFNALTILMNAASIVAFQVIVASVMAVTSITLSILFAHLFGIPGIVWGTLIAYLVCSAIPVVAYLPRMLRELGLSAERPNDAADVAVGP